MDVVKDPGSDQEQILTEMVMAYQSMLLRMCYVYLRDLEAAKDAVQETFLKAYQHLHSFRGECSQKTWLIQIAINTCKSMRRSAWFRHNDRRVTPEDIPQRIILPENNDGEIMAQIMELPPNLKEVIMLYYWQDMTVSDIAQLLSVAQSTVSRRLDRARQELRCMLDGRYQHGRSK